MPELPPTPCQGLHFGMVWNVETDGEQCDQGLPACYNCVKRMQLCPGYRDDFDIMHKDQNALVSEKVRKLQAAEDRKQSEKSRPKFPNYPYYSNTLFR